MQDLAGVKDILTIQDVGVVGVLILVIVYFIYENRQLKKYSREVVKEHQKDLKESSRDLQAINEKWNIVFGQLKDNYSNRR